MISDAEEAASAAAVAEGVDQAQRQAGIGTEERCKVRMSAALLIAVAGSIELSIQFTEGRFIRIHVNGSLCVVKGCHSVAHPHIGLGAPVIPRSAAAAGVSQKIQGILIPA